MWQSNWLNKIFLRISSFNYSDIVDVCSASVRQNLEQNYPISQGTLTVLLTLDRLKIKKKLLSVKSWG